MDWHDYYLNMCDAVAITSKDLSTKVGCVITSPDHRVRSTGYNGLPRGLADHVAPQYSQEFNDKINMRLTHRPMKMLITVHAEQNAFYNSSYLGVSTAGCILYVNSLPPCTKCALAILQCGVVEVHYNCISVPDRWKEDTEQANEWLLEAGIKVFNHGEIK